MLIGSQAVLDAPRVKGVADAVSALGIPVFLSGAARGLLGRRHDLLFRHRRRGALRAADVVVLAGVAADFRLDYGRQIAGRAEVIGVNRSRDDLTRNRKPDLAIHSDPGRFLVMAAERFGPPARPTDWIDELTRADAEREGEIAEMAGTETEHINPVWLLRQIEDALADDSVIVADGGDFVATASYVLSPRRPLSWLDPGPFGTLGVGGGFAAAAKLARGDAEVWLVYGDGSAAFSIAEFDTYVRHGLGVIAVVGNDGSWSQIARDQVDLLDDDVGTVLRRSDYHRVAEGFGGLGVAVRHPDEVTDAIAAAKKAAAAGTPVLINALIGTTEFRKGAISV
jgi:acetolactate synthase-1/2/3 large subunit